MINKIYTGILLAVLILGGSCRKRDIAVPSYIHIPAYSVVTDIGEGSNTSGFERVTVYIDDNPVGTYVLPATFPVLHSGSKVIQVRPVIKELARSGLKNNIMFEAYDTAMILTPGETDTLLPVFQYVDNVVFPWIEDFNDPVVSMNVSQGTMDTFYVENDPAHQVDGTSYCKINMGSGQTFFVIESDDLFDLPGDGRDVYLELDYKSNVIFTIGLYADEPLQIVPMPTVSPYPSNEWKKGYVQLRDELTNHPPGTSYRVFFRSVNGEPFIPEIYLDNLKLVYRD